MNMDPTGLAPMVFAVIFSCFGVVWNMRPSKPGAAEEVINNAGLHAFFFLKVGPCAPQGQYAYTTSLSMKRL